MSILYKGEIGCHYKACLHNRDKFRHFAQMHVSAFRAFRQFENGNKSGTL